MALRYWITGGTGNWNNTTNWSSGSGGSSGATVPIGGVSGDDVFFDSASGVGTATITSGAACKSINLTSFGGTLAMGVQNLNISGNVTIGSGMSSSQITGTGSLFILANSTFDILSGFTIPNVGMGITTSGVRVNITLVRDTSITNFTSTQNVPNTANNFGINRTSLGNGDNLFITGNFTHTANVTSITGNTTLNFITSGTSTLNNTQQTVNNVIINATGSLTGSLYKAGGTLVRTAGTVSSLNITIYNCSITSNGAIWQNVTSPAILSSTITTNDDLICTGTFTQFNSLGVNWIHNSGSIVRMRGTSSTINSTNLSVLFEGTQNCSIISGNQVSGLNMTFNPFVGSQISIGAFTLAGGGNTITYLDSNGGPTPIVTTTFTLVGANTFNTTPSSSNFIKWGAFTIGTAGTTLTLTTDLHISGTSTLLGNLIYNTSTGGKVYMGGTNAIVAPNGISGTATVVFYYSGTCQSSSGSIASNLEISPASGQTYVISSLFKSGAGSSITYIPSGGTVNASGTLSISPVNVLMFTSGVTWTNITTGNGSVLTLNEPLSVTNNLTLGGTVTFSGTSGWDCANLLCSTVGSVITLKTENTYNTSNSVNMLGSNVQRITMVSSSGTDRAIWTLAPAASQSMIYVNGTRIDSSLGQTIWSFGPPVLTDTLNWNPGTRPQTTAHTFIY